MPERGERERRAFRRPESSEGGSDKRKDDACYTNERARANTEDSLSGFRDCHPSCRVAYTTSLSEGDSCMSSRTTSMVPKHSLATPRGGESLGEVALSAVVGEALRTLSSLRFDAEGLVQDDDSSASLSSLDSGRFLGQLAMPHLARFDLRGRADT